MFLRRMRLQHFGAFRDTGWLEFGSGVNLVVGQNNSGKSSLIKSFESALLDAPHISLDAFRAEDLQRPLQEIELAVTGEELRRVLLARGGSIDWPLAVALDNAPQEFIDSSILGSNLHTMSFYRNSIGMHRTEHRSTHSGIQVPPTHFIQMVAQAPAIKSGSHGQDYRDSIVDLMPLIWNAILVFDTERISLGQCVQGEATRLDPRAGNLPAFLHIMRGRRPDLFDILVDHVRSIIPTVHSITTTPINNQETRILVWPTERRDQEQFGFPLASSGTGVGQVIAILAAAMSSDRTIFVIDEVNSYLHPTAVKALLRLLQNSYGHHQYIISTHSPEVISNGGASIIYLVKRNGMESEIKSVDMSSIDQLREMADHIGISVSDVFAADYVLWVEGRTEELCLSMLRDRLGIAFPANTIISPVIATGDFFSEKRNIDFVFQVYEKLARVSLPLVRSVAFSFDRESLTLRDMADTSRRAKGQVAFLPRRHLECYLIVPHAIAAFANEADSGRQVEYSKEAVEDLLKCRAGDPKYLANNHWKGRLNDQGWLAEVDAAKLIRDVLSELTEHRVHFTKAEHTARLLAAVIDIDVEPINGLIAHLRRLADLLSQNAADSIPA